MSKLIVTIFLLFFLAAPTAFAQPSRAKQIDSITRILPQLRDTVKLQAIVRLHGLHAGLPAQKQYIDMMLKEARRQKNVFYEDRALSLLSRWFINKHETDSALIVTKELIRFTREHKLYERLFWAHDNHVQHLASHGQTLTAIREAENAYSEAKDLLDNLFMSKMKATIGFVYNSMDLMEDAAFCYHESIELMA